MDKRKSINGSILSISAVIIALIVSVAANCIMQAYAQLLPLGSGYVTYAPQSNAIASTWSEGSSNPLLDKEEFDITVSNIVHQDVEVGLVIDGVTQTSVIKGNPPTVITPTSQVVVFKFDRNGKTPLPIKLGDEYTPCIRTLFTKASCLRAGVDSLTQPQKKSLDVRYIPSELPSFYYNHCL